MNRHFFVIRRRILMMLMMFVSIILFCAIGCDQNTRYKIMTFFFEGVPEPGAKKTRSAANQMITMQGANGAQRETRTVQADNLGQKRASRHEFSRDCAQCHTGGLRSGQQELRVPLSDLCYSCHSDLYREGEYLHGPLYVGECVFCHDPHQSAFIHLQKAPQPDLCFRCHQKDDIVLIPGHREVINGVCTDCHEPHGGSIPKLLKAERTGRERMKELLNLEVNADVLNPKLKSDTALTGIGLSPDDPNIVN